MVASLSLRSADALHLATAIHVGAVAFETYDDKLLNPQYATMTGLAIRMPAATQPRLPGQ